MSTNFEKPEEEREDSLLGLLVLAYVWDARTSTYRPRYVPKSGGPGSIPATGEPVIGPDELRELVENIRHTVSARLQRLAGRVKSGNLTNLAEFKTAFAEEIKHLYVSTHVLARGGYEQMTQSAWGQLGSALKEQYEYLGNLVRDLENGLIGVRDVTGNVIVRPSGIPELDDTFLQRVGLYTDSAWGAAGEYERVVRDRQLAKGSLERRFLGDSKEKCQDCLNQAALGWQSPGILWDIGDTECGPGCRCHFEYKQKGTVSAGNAFYGKAFNPDQPRVPAGSSRGGEFASQGGLGIPVVEQQSDSYDDMFRITARGSKPRISDRAALEISTVLAEMKAKGYKMPERVVLRRGAISEDPSGVTNFDPTRPVTLTINIPDTLPDDANLDDVVKIAYGKKFNGQDEYAPRTFKDIVVHEMGHVQRGFMTTRYWSIFYPSLGSDTAQAKKLEDAIYGVSRYAAGEPNEFVAEAFTRQYRGETLSPAAQEIYKTLGGPKIR